MELRHLRYFVAVAEELNFVRAAERLSVAQPSLSQQIRDLEQELGVKLLDRSRKQIELTRAGLIFLEEARRTLAQAEQATLAVQQFNPQRTDRLAICYNNLCPFYPLPLILRHFKQNWPQLELIVQDMSTPRQLRELSQGRVDVAFILEGMQALNDLKGPTGSLNQEVIWREQIVVALPRQHRLAGQSVIKLDELRDESWVWYSSRSEPHLHEISRQLFFERWGKAFPKITHQVSTQFMGLQLVGLGSEITLMPEGAQRLQLENVTFAKLIEPETFVNWSILWSNDNCPPPVQAFLQATREVIAYSSRREILPATPKLVAS